MNRSNLVIASLLAGIFSTSVECGDSTPGSLPDPKNIQIFLLAGQSNMAGRGDITPGDLEVHPQVLMLTKDGNWQYAVDPVHYDKSRAGVGLARSFALELLEKDPGITIGLVPAACGGSPISSWAPGGYHDQTDSHPYDDAIERTNRAMQDGTLAGILWHQGESDSRPERATNYKERLTALIERFRRDLNAQQVPFIIGQLGQFEGKPWNEARQQVNRAQIEIAEEVPLAAFVSSDGLTSKADNTHFNTASLHEFGRRYAEAWLQLVRESQPADSD